METSAIVKYADCTSICKFNDKGHIKECIHFFKNGINMLNTSLEDAERKPFDLRRYNKIRGLFSNAMNNMESHLLNNEYEDITEDSEFAICIWEDKGKYMITISPIDNDDIPVAYISDWHGRFCYEIIKYYNYGYDMFCYNENKDTELWEWKAISRMEYEKVIKTLEIVGMSMWSMLK